MFRGCRILQVLLAGAMLAATVTAPGQRGGSPGGGGRPGGGMPMGGQPGMPGNGGMMGPLHSGTPPPNSPDQGGTMSTMRGGLQLGPPGRWWDDKHFAKDIKLSGDQQKRMDSIFEQNRPVLLKRYEELKQEESHMEDLTHAKTLDESALFAQIDRIAQARANLEKANTHLLYQLRGEMDLDQIGRLEQHR